MESVLHSPDEIGTKEDISFWLYMEFVYLLQSINFPDKRYIGITEDLQKRFNEHNSGKSPYTSKFCPWKIVVAIKFENNGRAHRFERYLKTGSGYAFASKHFWQ